MGFGPKFEGMGEEHKFWLFFSSFPFHTPP
jgi:hypothetical protein